MTGKVTAYDHLDLERLAFVAYGNHRVGNGYLPVGEDIVGSVEELGGYLVEYLTLKGNTCSPRAALPVLTAPTSMLLWV